MVVNQISRRELFHKFKSNIPISRMLTVTPTPAFMLSKLNFTAVSACINMEVSLLSTSSRAQISWDDGISVSYYLPSCPSFLDGSTGRLQPNDDTWRRWAYVFAKVEGFLQGKRVYLRGNRLYVLRRSTSKGLPLNGLDGEEFLGQIWWVQKDDGKGGKGHCPIWRNQMLKKTGNIKSNTLFCFQTKIYRFSFRVWQWWCFQHHLSTASLPFWVSWQIISMSVLSMTI